MTFDSLTYEGTVIASLTQNQVCYKIGFIETNTQIHWTNHVLRKILGVRWQDGTQTPTFFQLMA